MPILSYTLSGFEGAESILRALGAEAPVIANRVIDEGAQVIADLERKLAPRRQGPVPRKLRAKKRLHQSIVVSKTLGRKSQRRYGGFATVERWIGPTAAHAPLVEFGHLLVKVRRSQRAAKKGKPIGRRTIGHVPARPFARPAEASTRAHVTDLMARRFGEEAMDTMERWSRQAASGTISVRGAAALGSRPAPRVARALELAAAGSI